MDFDSKRLSLYDKDTIVELEVRQVNPEQHTMTKNPFLDYIGRYNPSGYEIKCKKFSTEQQEALSRAFIQKFNVKILGAYQKDLDKIADVLDLTLLEEPFWHSRDKIFNKQRQVMQFVLNNQGNQELIVCVFPSKQYVQQVSELIQAIFDDYRNNDLEGGSVVSTIYFPSICETIAEWTGFNSGVARFIRTGDVVIIGQVELLENGLNNLGFDKPNSHNWIFFGIDEMFGACFYIDMESRRRTLLIGFRECFWGDASAQYVTATLSAGARHVLYASKAASLINREKIHSVSSVKSCYYLLGPDLENQLNSKSQESQVKYNDKVINDTTGLMSVCGIDLNETAITVPTVIGEDQNQRDLYKSLNPLCMDCENGHISQAVSNFNRTLVEADIELEMANYLPAHFITDYIHKEEESSSVDNEGLHMVSPEKQKKQIEAFNKIGHFFAIYSMKHSPDSTMVLSPLRNQMASDLEVEDYIPLLRNYIESGQGREAIRSLMDMFPKGLPNNAVIATAIVAQKFGFDLLLHQAMNSLENETIGELDKVRLAMLDFKFSVQVRDLRTAHDRYLELRDQTESLSKISQLDAFYRRVALLQGYYGEIESGYNTFNYVINQSPDTDSHSPLSTELYKVIFDLLTSSMGLTQNNISSWRSSLKKTRNGFLNLKDSSLEGWQTNTRKCAVSCLFLEAAILLSMGTKNERSEGKFILYVAHVLNSDFGGTEAAETFGEILCSIRDISDRTMIASAMRQDARARDKFQKSLRQHDWLSEDLSKQLLSVANSSSIELSSGIQNIIDTHGFNF